LPNSASGVPGGLPVPLVGRVFEALPLLQAVKRAKTLQDGLRLDELQSPRPMDAEPVSLFEQVHRMGFAQLPL